MAQEYPPRVPPRTKSSVPNDEITNRQNGEAVWEPPINSLPISIIVIDTDFTDLHIRCCPGDYVFTGCILLNNFD